MQKITYPSMIVRICELYLDNSNSIQSIADLLSISRSVVDRVIRESDLPKRIKAAKRKTRIPVNENYFEKIDSAEKAWILGFIAGDAYIYKYGLKIELKLKDIEILELIKKALNADQKIKTRKRFHKIWKTESETCYILICREKLTLDLENHGVGHNKSKELHIPKTIPEEFISDFIRGVFCSDGGWVSTTSPDGNINNLIFAIYSSTYDFLKEIQNVLINKCGFDEIKIYSQPGCYRLAYGGNDQCKIFYDYIYKNAGLFLKRKFDYATEHFELIKRQYLNKEKLKIESKLTNNESFENLTFWNLVENHYKI